MPPNQTNEPNINPQPVNSQQNTTGPVPEPPNTQPQNPAQNPATNSTGYGGNAYQPVNQQLQQPTPNSGFQSQSSPVSGGSGDFMQNQAMQPPKKSRKPSKRLLIILVAGLFIVFGGTAAGAYFGWYVPNDPDKIWKSSMVNTSKAYDKVVTKSKEQPQKSGGIMKGTMNFNLNGLVGDGNIETKYSKNNSVTKADIGASGVRIKADVLTSISENSTYPDVYMKAEGLKGLEQIFGASAASAANSLQSIDNQWYVVDHTLFDQAAAGQQVQEGQAAETSQNSSLTQERAYKVLEVVGKLNKEYAFPEDASKSMFKIAEKVGKEQLDSRGVYHYKVSYDKERMKAYMSELSDELAKLNIPGVEIADKDSINKSIDQLSGNEKVDVWVDLKTKLVRKIRINDSKNQNNYLDISMPYNGGEEVPVNFEVRNSETNNEVTMKFDLVLNLNKDVLKMKFGLNGKTNNQPYNFNLDGTLTGSDESVEFTKPEGAKSLLESGLLGSIDTSGFEDGGITTQPIVTDPPLNSGTEAPEQVQVITN